MSDNHQEREVTDFAPIRKRLAEIKKRRDELPAGKGTRAERQMLNRQIRKLEQTLNEFSES